MKIIEPKTASEFSDQTVSASENEFSDQIMPASSINGNHFHKQNISNDNLRFSQDDSAAESETTHKALAVWPRFSRPRYVGDCNSDEMCSPRRAKRNWKLATQTIIKQRKKIKALQQSKRRLKRRVVSLGALLKYLQERNMITENVQTMMNVSS